jgi:hypothetical protein
VRIEAIGVYEGQRTPESPRRTPDGRPVPGTVQVAVGATEGPIALVLSSYEPVHWILSATGKMHIKHILLSGSDASTVRGVAGVPLTFIGGGYAYEPSSAGYGNLNAAVQKHAGRPIDRLQGAYRAERFSLGTILTRDVSPTDGPRTPGAYKCRDATGGVSYSGAPCRTLGLEPIGEVAAPLPPVTRTSPSVVTPSNPRHQSPRLRPGEKIMRCGSDVIVCDAADTIICNGRQVPCQ